MTEYSALWDQSGTYLVIGKDDNNACWHVVLTAPDKFRAVQVADALNAREALLND